MSSLENHQNKTNTTIKSTLQYIAFFIILLIAINALRERVAIKVCIPSGSMENTLNIGDGLLIDSISYKITGIHRGDIMVFKREGDDFLLIKRVIGLPGETIEGKDGYVYIGGNKLNETYVSDLLNEDFGPYTIPDKEYFMMGDNRLDSADSRYWSYPYVSINNFKGRAYFRYRGGIGLLKRPRY